AARRTRAGATVTLGLCIPSSLGPDVGAAVAPEIERLGYDTFWSNDGRAGPGMPILAAAQKVTARIRLGVGVIPIDVRPPDEGERRGGRPPGTAKVAMYGRVAVGPGAQERLTAEAERYARLPNYRTAFEAMGVETAEVGIAKPTADGVSAGLVPYQAVLDET